MNKNKKNKKLIKQNKRNKIINKRYLSTIKNLLKIIKTKKLNNLINFEEKQKILLNRFYSIIDKAVKKKIIHKNTAARKKSKISVLIK
jgi:small subunit ribosomal protein S20